MRKRIRKAIVLLASAAMLASGFAGTITASDASGEKNRMPELDTSKQCDVTIEVAYPKEKEADTKIGVSGVKVDIIKVADVAWAGGSVDYTLTSELASTKVDFEALSTADAMEKAAKTLEAAVSADAALSKSVIEKATDTNGDAVYSALPQGMYLAYQNGTGLNNEGVLVTFAPFLFSVPYISRETQEWQYSNIIYTKPHLTDANGIGEIEVTKQYLAVVDGVEGAVPVLVAPEKETTFHFGLFLDDAGKQNYLRDGANYVIDITLGNDKMADSNKFVNLARGTYYVFECDEKGNNARVPGNGTHYAANTDDETAYMTVEMGVDDKTKEQSSNKISLDPKADIVTGSCVINNIEHTAPPVNPAIDARIEIIKKVLKDEKPVIAENQKFYARIFKKDANGTLVPVSSKVLLMQNGKTAPIKVPLGGPEGKDPITYYVYEVDGETGEIIDKDNFDFDVTDGIEVKVAADKDGVATIINEAHSVVPTKPDEDHNISTNTNTTTSVQTGDETPIELFIGIAAGAFIILILLVILFRRRRNA